MNTIEKLLKKSMIAMTVLSLAGCTLGKKDESVHQVNDGTYTGIGTGYNGYITVSVGFRDGKLTNVSVFDQTETKSVSQAALEKIPEYVVNNQSLNVDVSTGATVTSRGVLEAIGNAITAANGNVDDWQKDCTGQNEEKVIQEKSDVTVVGGGVAGIATVLRLQQQGYKTTLIEKDSELGGSLRYQANGGQIVAGSTSIEDTVSSADLLAQDITTLSGETNNPALTQLLTENIGETVDWESKILGITFNKKQGFIQTEGISGSAVLGFDETSGKIDELLRKEVQVSGSNVYTNTGIVGLRYNSDGKITGVTAKKANGDIVETYSDYVVLATGSSAGNLNLVAESDRTSHYLGLTTNTGDSLILANNEEHPYQIEENNAAVYNYLGFNVRDIMLDTFAANTSILSKGLMLVNNSGQRFVDESLAYNEISDAIQNQNNASAYLVMNASNFETWKKTLLSMALLTEPEEKFLEGEYVILPYRGDNLLEAAESADLDPEAVLGSVATRNDEINALDSTSKLGTLNPGEPVCIIPLSKYRYETTGGLKVNEQLNLLDGSGNPITNIYAAGSVAGNVFGDRMPSGAGLAWAFVSGKYVADQIIADKSAE